ncbi:hypothetical protein N0V90_008105 [Kalmusia sp. IMI 367209]|nr:hypothetical protein N0V90_008105 [Kalmusia sp. IMI 367209]
MYARAILLAAIAATFGKAEVHTIDVGEDGLEFEPKTINPKKGDTVIFHLYPQHNVVSTSFNSPCVSSDNGFFSGPFGQTDNGKKKFVVNVTSEDPVWYYCAVQKHCQNGMVGAWNAPTSGNTIDAFADAAKNVGQSSTPSSIKGGELLEDEQLASLTSGSASPTESESSSSAKSTSGATTTASQSGSASATGSQSPSESAASSTPTPGAADVVTTRPATGVLAMAVGLLAWLV